MKKKKTESKKVLIEFDEKHLSTLTTALEVYSRLRSGQIKMAVDSAFYNINLSYKESQYIENAVRFIVFPSTPIREYDGHGGFYDQYSNEYNEEGSIINESAEWKTKKLRPHLDHPNSSFGVGCGEMKDGTVAWEIKKAIEQYQHYQRNDGMRRICDVSGDGAMQLSEVPVPKIIESNGYWKPQKSFIIPKRYQKYIDASIKIEKYSDVWSVVDKAFKKTPLPRGKESRIEKYNDSYYVVVQEPYKLD
jgi:hypothetical protein